MVGWLKQRIDLGAGPKNVSETMKNLKIRELFQSKKGIITDGIYIDLR